MLKRWAFCSFAVLILGIIAFLFVDRVVAQQYETWPNPRNSDRFYRAPFSAAVWKNSPLSPPTGNYSASLDRASTATRAGMARDFCKRLAKPGTTMATIEAQLGKPDIRKIDFARHPKSSAAEHNMRKEGKFHYWLFYNIAYHPGSGTDQLFLEIDPKRGLVRCDIFEGG
jgi:hypothetical protein